VTAALTDTAAEGSNSFTRNLLDGASDPDDGETATLAVTGVTYSVNDGTASATAPAGVSLSGHTLTVNPANPAFDYLAVGQSATIKIGYDVTDVHGAKVHQTETVTITGTNDAPSIVGETNPPTHGVMVVNPLSPNVEDPGQNTNTIGLVTEDFNSKAAGEASNNGTGTGNFSSSVLGATFTASGHAGIVLGSSSVTAAPFMGPLPGSADTTKYLSIGAGATETITFDSAKNAFGLYWGSVDDYNTIKFYNGTTLVASYTGADISPLLATGNQGSFAANGYVDFVGLPFFTKVVLGSTSNAFEIDNISAGVVPTSHAKLVGTVSGTMSVHDPDIGDTLTGLVTQKASVLYNNSSDLPSGVSVGDLIKATNITFDSVQSDGGTDILHWSFDPHGANLDFLHAGDVLKLTFTAQVSDSHGSSGSQQLVVTLVGTDNETNVSSFKFVDGTSGNDTFNNVGGGTTVYGNGGNDNFVFKPGSGSATIADFDPATDTITFASSMFNHNPANVLAATNDDHHGNTVITVNATDTITLQHVVKAQLSAADFHFV
jgi:VCBS repeat-containing protein